MVQVLYRILYLFYDYHQLVFIFINTFLQDEKSKDYKFCQSCVRIKEQEAIEMCGLGNKIERVDGSLNQVNYYLSFILNLENLVF